MSRPGEKIGFVSRRDPAMHSGTYTLEVSHAIETPQGGESLRDRKRFHVNGERFDLDPRHVHGCFPPADGRGDFTLALPHVVLDRPTWPWTRSAGPKLTRLRELVVGAEGELPWLALITLDELARARTSTQAVPLGQLVRGEGWKLEPGERPEHVCEVLEIPTALLDELVPTLQDMVRLTHVRRVDLTSKQDSPGHPAQRDYAVIVGHRLPTSGETHTVHLVSLEGYHDPERKAWYRVENERVQLVSLYKWSFEEQPSDARSERVDPKRAGNFSLLLGRVRSGVFRSRLDEAPEGVDEILDAGYTLLSHRVRQGDRTISLYRGPLVPYIPGPGIEVPLHCADEALIYRRDHGVFDVSYAVAWQLGRSLALQDEDRIRDLARARAQRRRARLAARERELHGSGLLDPIAALASTTLSDHASSSELAAWLGRLESLAAVPLTHLIPDARMLPDDGLRFFHVDPTWVACLVDGARSVGRNTSSDFVADADLSTELGELASTGLLAIRHDAAELGTLDSGKTTTGVLLRSAIVERWPGTEITGFGVDGPLTTLSIQRRGPDVLMCLFLGTVERLEIAQPRESLRFGFEIRAEQGLRKKLRDPRHGSALGDPSIDVETRGASGSRTVDIAKLAAAMAMALKLDLSTFGAEQFALQMVAVAASKTFARGQP